VDDLEAPQHMCVQRRTTVSQQPDMQIKKPPQLAYGLARCAARHLGYPLVYTFYLFNEMKRK
jgi:hypothetical protein